MSNFVFLRVSLRGGCDARVVGGGRGGGGGRRGRVVIVEVQSCYAEAEVQLLSCLSWGFVLMFWATFMSRFSTTTTAKTVTLTHTHARTHKQEEEEKKLGPYTLWVLLLLLTYSCCYCIVLKKMNAPEPKYVRHNYDLIELE